MAYVPVGNGFSLPSACWSVEYPLARLRLSTFPPQICVGTHRIIWHIPQHSCTTAVPRQRSRPAHHLHPPRNLSSLLPPTQISVQKTVPELDHLLNCYVDAPSSSSLTPSADESATSPRAAGGRLSDSSHSHSQQPNSIRRSPAAATAASFGSPLAGLGKMGAVGLGGGRGESLLDVSGISGIAGGNDYNYSDSSGLFRGGGGGGVNNSGRYNLEDKDDYDSSTTGSNKRSSALGGERSPGWQRPISGRMASRAAAATAMAMPSAISPHVDAVLASRTASLGLGRGRVEGQAVRTPARSRSPLTDSFLLMHGGSSGGGGGGDGSGGGIGGGSGENGRAVYGAGRSGTMVRRGGGAGGDVGVSREWNARGDESEGEADY